MQGMIENMRHPLGKSYINPKIANILIDSCAFDPKYHPEEESSQKLFELHERGAINLIGTGDGRGGRS